MATRTVSGKLIRSDGSPWRRGVVRFTLRDDASLLAPDETFPSGTIVVLTDDTGALLVDLSAGAGFVYQVTLPDGSTFDMEVPTGAATTMEALRAAYQP